MIDIKIEAYEGPFDLLLELIRKSKINIYDIKISEITDEFIKRMDNLDISPDNLADFISMASILLNIKISTLTNIEDEEEEITKEELIQRLIEYSKFKDISKKLRELEEYSFNLYSKLQEDLSVYESEEEEIVIDTNINSFSSLYRMLMLRYLESDKDEFKVEKILRTEEYSVDTYIDKIEERLTVEEAITFRRLLEGTKRKSEIIVIFLGILEMSRTNRLKILQTTEEIYIKKIEGIKDEL